MNEINFKMEEIEEINLKLDTSIKEIYPPLTNLEVIPTKEKQIFNHDGAYGYDKVVVNSIILQDKEVIPSKEEQTIKADENYSGLNQVKVNAVTSQVDNNIISENIKNGIDILGVTGNFVGGKYAPRFISFYGYTGTNLNDEIIGLDTSNTTSMSNMFYNCSNLTALDLSSFNTSNVTDMQMMLYGCKKITKLDISNFNIAKVNLIQNLFYQCKLLTSLDLRHFGKAPISNMNFMFYGCENLTEVDLSNFEITKTNTYNTKMFGMCTKLMRIDLRSLDFTKLYSAVSSYMFGDNESLGVPNNCLIIVKDEISKNWITSRWSRLTNVKTVAELEAS